MSMPARPPEAPSPPRSWYGYQTLAVDGTAVALALVSFKTGSEPAAWAASGLYLLGAPTVHAFHRRGVAAAASMGMRILVPLISAQIGAALVNCTRGPDGDDCHLGGLFVGLGVGAALAAALDSVLVGWEPAPSDPLSRPPGSPGPLAEAAPTATLSLSPIPLLGGAGLVLGGRF